MHHVMFDIDGTLIESQELDSLCFSEAVKEITGIDMDTDWRSYKDATDAGILNEFFELNNIQNCSAITDSIKLSFLAKLKYRMAKNTINEIPGASAFLYKLKTLDDVVVSFATGGWYESAILKLQSAGIDFSGIAIASSNDHYQRTQIMKIAENRVSHTNAPLTYFGDGIWDLKACNDLGINFVLVGDKVKHNQKIKDFLNQKKALAFIGLSKN